VRALLVVIVALLGLQQTPPPPFPRAGTTKLFENERVVVWDIAWLRETYPLHRHPYDMTGVYYQSGDRVIISPQGERRSTHTEAWNITFQRVGLTHSEEGSSEPPLRAVFIEMKQPSLGFDGASDGAPAYPVGAPSQRLDNDRVAVWEHAAGAAPTLHRHAREAVVVTFDASLRPSVRYLARGTEHDDAHTAARAFVFEIK